MVARVVGVSFVLFAFCFVVGTLEGQDKKDAVKPGPALLKDHKDLVGNVKTVDLKANSFTITVEEVKKPDRVFNVTKDTKFIGPRGGLSDEGLKDDRMDPGYQVRVIYHVKDAKTAVEVHLPYRKKEEAAKDKDKAAKDKK